MSDKPTPDGKKSNPRKEKRPRRWLRRLLILVIVLAAIAAMLWLIPTDLEVDGYGNVMSVSDSVLRVSAKGPVAKVLVQSGDDVEKDHLILQLDDTEQRANEQRVESQLAEANAELARLRSDHEVQRSEQDANIQSATAARDIALEAWESVKKLSKSGVASEREQRQAKLAVALATAHLRSVSVERDALRRAEIEVRQRQIATLRADLKLRREQVRLRKVFSPMAGVVVMHEVSEGQVIDADTVIGQVFSKGPRVAMVRMSEANLWFLKPGLGAEIEPVAYPESRFGYLTGEVKSISDVVAPHASGDGTVNVCVSLDTPKSEDIDLKPGMTCRVWIRAGKTRLLWRILPVRVFELIDED